MKFSFILFSISFLLSVFGYGQPVISWDAQEKMPVYSHSKDKKFKLEKKKIVLKDTTLIDTNYVYIYKSVINVDGHAINPDTMYYFVRFFKNGQVFVSDYFRSEPTIQECNTITYGKRGYFTIKDNVLVIELFINTYDGYWFSYYKKHKNSIMCFKTEPRCLSFLISKKEKKCVSIPPYRKKVSFQTQATW